MDKAILVDLDGTLCNVDHRIHFIRSEKKDWHQFHSQCENDDIEIWCQKLIQSMGQSGYQVLIMTGRDEPYRESTESWLNKHKINWHSLYMRPDKDYRPDHIVKWELYQKHIESHFDVLFVVEDRKSVVEMWREKGLRCLQCAPGDF